MEARSVDLGAKGFVFGRIVFGTAAFGSGLLQLATGAAVRLVQSRLGWMPAPALWPYVGGLVLVAAGVAILLGWRTRTAASVVGLLVIFVVLPLFVPPFLWNPVVDHPFFRGFMYTNPLKSLALVGGAAMLAAWSAGEERSPLLRAFGRIAPRGPLLLSVFLTVCGIQHYWYAPFVVTLVPEWMPARMFWTYFTGAALVAGGLGLLWPRTTRLAAALSALMIFLWVLMLHIPRALTLPDHAGETAGVFEALALSGVALLVAGGEAPAARAAPETAD